MMRPLRPPLPRKGGAEMRAGATTAWAILAAVEAPVRGVVCAHGQPPAGWPRGGVVPLGSVTGRGASRQAASSWSRLPECRKASGTVVPRLPAKAMASLSELPVAAHSSSRSEGVERRGGKGWQRKTRRRGGYLTRKEAGPSAHLHWDGSPSSNAAGPLQLQPLL